MICKVCQKELKSLTNTHLNKHSLTPKEYENIYGEKTVPNGWCVGENNNFYGKSHIEGKSKVKSLEYKTAAKIRFKGKTLIELYGIDKGNKLLKAMSDRMSGTNNPMYGYVRSDEEKENLSRIMTGRFAGEKHPMWMGGIAYIGYPNEFNNMLKRYIRNRENKKCFICNKLEKDNIRKLDIHHIDYNKQNNNLNNLCALCHSCHIKTNTKRYFWKNILKNALIFEYGNQQPSLDSNI